MMGRRLGDQRDDGLVNEKSSSNICAVGSARIVEKSELMLPRTKIICVEYHGLLVNLIMPCLVNYEAR